MSSNTCVDFSCTEFGAALSYIRHAIVAMKENGPLSDGKLFYVRHCAERVEELLENVLATQADGVRQAIYAAEESMNGATKKGC